MYVCAGVAVFFVTLPTNLSGRAAKFVNNTNMTATACVIVLAIIKGLWTARLSHQVGLSPTLKAFDMQGLVPVVVLMSASMLAVSAVPQLNYELAEVDRSRGAALVPCIVALMHGAVFLGLGLAGYLALGSKAQGDVFAVYAVEHPDWMVSLLQWGLALLTFLSCPLMQLPAKTQLWAFIRRAAGFKLSSDLTDAPPAINIGLNLAITSLTTLLPLLLSEQAFILLIEVLAGTAGNWLSLLLPAFLLIFADLLPSKFTGIAVDSTAVQFLPSRSRRARQRRSALASMWLLALAFFFLKSSVSELRQQARRQPL